MLEQKLDQIEKRIAALLDMVKNQREELKKREKDNQVLQARLNESDLRIRDLQDEINDKVQKLDEAKEQIGRITEWIEDQMSEVE